MFTNNLLTQHYDMKARIVIIFLSILFSLIPSLSLIAQVFGIDQLEELRETRELLELQQGTILPG